MIHLPTCEGGILREDVVGCWSKHNEDIDDAAFRDPTHICLRCLTGALHVIQHFPKHSLARDKSEWVKHWAFVKQMFTTGHFLVKTVPGTKEKEKGTYLSSCVGADIHPGLGGIEPEDACGPLGIVGQHDWDSAVKGHRVIQLVLEHIQVVEPIWISITETEKHTHTHSGLIQCSEDHTDNTACATQCKIIFKLPFVCEIWLVVDTHSVVLSLRVSACSGMP